MKAALWFLVRSIAFSLLTAVLYWHFVGQINHAFIRLADRGWQVRAVTYELEPMPNRENQIQVYQRFGDQRQRFSIFDGIPFHFNVAILIGFFLATPGISLRRKVLSTALAMLLLLPTQIMHIYFNLVQITTLDLHIRQHSVPAWASDVGTYFYYQALRHASIFMKQTGTIFIPLVIWCLFFLNKVRFLFFPVEQIEEYVQKASEVNLDADLPVQPST